MLFEHFLCYVDNFVDNFRYQVCTICLPLLYRIVTIPYFYYARTRYIYARIGEAVLSTNINTYQQISTAGNKTYELAKIVLQMLHILWTIENQCVTYVTLLLHFVTNVTKSLKISNFCNKL